jgi:two-component system, NtrC family, response regulator HydG
VGARLQVRLLRALQERCLRPVGSDQELPFNARVLAATHRDLDAEVAAGRFRPDLLFRINVLEIRLPPLRQRGRDILLLADAFIARASQRLGRKPLPLSRVAAARLMAHDWPGNVRELENYMERAVVYARGDELDTEDLPERLRAPAFDALFVDEPSATGQDLTSSRPMDGLLSLAEMERRYILHVLRAVGGNRKLAALILALDRSTLYRKLYRYGDS